MPRTCCASAPRSRGVLLGSPPPKNFLLKIRGTGGDAPLEFRIGLTQRCFSALPLIDLSTKKLVCPRELRRAGKRQRERHHLPDRGRGADGEQSRGRFDAAVEPIVWKPKGPNAHNMGGAAGKNEETRQHENAGEGEVGAL